MLQNDLGPICRLGRIVMSPGVKKALSGKDLLNALLLHMRGGKSANEAPPASDRLEGCRFLNVYRSSKDQSFWIITEADRKLTTVLMPEEF